MFQVLFLTGNDAAKFLQGQLTININKLTDTPSPCAICDLKGRVAFGLWACRTDEGFGLILADELVTDFVAHIKKYGAFSKISLSSPAPCYPCVADGMPTFCEHAKDSNFEAWKVASVAHGNYWITSANQHLFQPQELRLHQRGGVDYDKGCYLGQEIVARLYFKASPKAYLHRIRLDPSKLGGILESTDENWAGKKLEQGQIVNAITTQDGVEVLCIIRPDEAALIGQVLEIEGLSGSVARR